MRKEIDRRLAAAEQVAKSSAGGLEIIKVTGGLPGAVRCANADGLHYERLPEESVEGFEDRVIAAAIRSKSKTLMIGGLCGCAWKTPGSFQTYLDGPDFRLPD